MARLIRLNRLKAVGMGTNLGASSGASLGASLGAPCFAPPWALPHARAPQATDGGSMSTTRAGEGVEEGFEEQGVDKGV